MDRKALLERYKKTNNDDQPVRKGKSSVDHDEVERLVEYHYNRLNPKEGGR